MRHERYAVVRDEGVFIGAFMGITFWSLWDTAGQPKVAVFASEEQARQFFAPVGEEYVAGLKFVKVLTALDRYASADELEEAGVPRSMV